MLPPKGPAALLLTTFIRQKSLAPVVGSEPVQVVPAGILTVKGYREVISLGWTGMGWDGMFLWMITYSVSTDVGSTTADAHSSQSTLDDVALSVTDQVGGSDQLGAAGVGTGTGGVDDSEQVTSLVVSGTIAGHHAPGAGDGTSTITRDLGQGLSGQGHGGSHISHLQVAVGGSLAETISQGLVGVTAVDGGVLLGSGVGTESSDGVTFDTQSSTVATHVATVEKKVLVIASEWRGDWKEKEGIG